MSGEWKGHGQSCDGCLMVGLIAERDEARAALKDATDPNGQMAQHHRHEGALEARGLCASSGLPQRQCKASICDCFVPSIDDLIRERDEARVALAGEREAWETWLFRTNWPFDWQTPPDNLPPTTAERMGRIWNERDNWRLDDGEAADCIADESGIARSTTDGGETVTYDGFGAPIVHDKGHPAPVGEWIG